MRAKLLLICCLCVCTGIAAQSRRSVKLYGKGEKYKAAKRTGKAYKKMSKSINKSPRTPEAYSELGEWYFQAHKFTEAAEVFKNASAKCRNGGARFSKPYARALIYSGAADRALAVIATYATTRDSAEWNRAREQALFIKQNSGRPSCPPPARMNSRVNSEFPELYPSMAADTSILYFTRRVNNENDDFFAVTKDTCDEWYNARNLGYPANTADQELAQCISDDGHYLFITRCDNRSDDGYAEGGCDMFMAYRVSNDSEWSTPQPFGFTINTPDFEGMPSVSPDTRELYFVSDRKGGYGGYDIYVSRFENGLWQQPVNAGPSINTAGNETAPYINPDNKTLFFTSDGHPGFGGTDLFVSRRNSDGTWTQAVNMGFPINTAYDEKSACMTLDGKKLFFASDRNGPAGNFDIYEAYAPYDMKPEPVSYISGFVYDSLEKTRLTSASMYICTRRGDTLYEFKSNRGDASFLITLPLRNTYIIHTGYMGHVEKLDTIVFDKQYTQEPLTRYIAMLPNNWDELKTISDTLIGTIHFEANITDLSDEDKKSLTEALAPWLEHKNYIITVNAYTDNSGNPMLNEELSARRAAIVAGQIVALGVDGTTILSKGWGEINPVTTNDTEEGRHTNRRVEIRVRR